MPSAEVLDELLRAFSVDVNDRARLEQVDLASPEVDELLAAGPEASYLNLSLNLHLRLRVNPRQAAVDAQPDVATDPAPAADGERPPATTIVISGENDPPDAVYLAAGDPLLLAPAAVSNRTTVDEAGSQRVFIDDAVTGGDAEVISLEDATTATRIEPRLRERRIAVKRSAGRKRLKWLLVVAILVAIVIAGLTVLGSGLFAIEDVDVQGAVYTDPVALETVVEELRGTPVLRADTEAAERALEAIPWVADARVTAHFPRRASIELRERTPVATFQGVDGLFRVIDADGRVLDVIDSQPVDYVLVTSPDAPALAPAEYAPPGFRAAASLVQALTVDMRAVTAAVATQADGSDLRLTMTDGTEVHFGAGRDLVAKLVRLQTWLDIGRDGAVSSVDVSTDEVTTRP